MILIPVHLDVLVVDDDDLDRIIIGRVLDLCSLANPIRFFSDGTEAIEHLDALSSRGDSMPGLALLDVNMPGLTGFDVLTHVRSRQEFAELPIVTMLTSSDAEDDRRRAKELGANAYLAKQSGIDEFVTLVNSHFTN